MGDATTVQLELDKCARCGKCLSVCPSYIETRDEVRVARGRIALFDAVLSGRLPYTGGVAEAARSCLGCLRCSYVCVNDVHFDRVLLELKRQMPRLRMVSAWERFMFRTVLGRRRLMDVLMRVAAAFQRLLPKGRGMTRHLPLLFKGGRRLPELAKRTVIQRYGTDRADEPDTRKTVYFFPGCLTNYAYTAVADSIVNVLRHFGYDVIVPANQVCCGTPALAFGFVDEAKALARTNMREMPGDAPVLTGCASCGETLKTGYRELLGEEAEQFSSRVYDFAEFLDRFVDFRAAGIRTKVVYHDPCHLRYGQDVTEAPRRLLKAATDYEEVEGADACCGMAGLFSVHHQALSNKIARRKMDTLRRVEAEVIATECPGCMLQLHDRLEAEGIPIRVRHVAEVLEEALGLKDK